MIEDGIGDYIDDLPFTDYTFHHLYYKYIRLLEKSLSLFIKIFIGNSVSLYFLKLKLGLIKREVLPLIALKNTPKNESIFCNMYNKVSENIAFNDIKIIFIGSVYFPSDAHTNEKISIKALSKDKQGVNR